MPLDPHSGKEPPPLRSLGHPFYLQQPLFKKLIETLGSMLPVKRYFKIALGGRKSASSTAYYHHMNSHLLFKLAERTLEMCCVTCFGFVIFTVA